MSHGDTELDLSKLGLVSLVGPNGAGKSAIMGGICYALYGKYLKSSEEEMIRDGQDKMIVEFDFEFSGHHVRIERERVRDDGGTAKMFIDGQMKAEGLKYTNAEVIKLIKMDFEVFIATAYFLQGELDRFTGATPSVRKEYLASILELHSWEHWHNKVKQRLKKLKEETERIGTEVDVIQNTFDINKNFDAEIKKLTQKKEEHQSTIKKLKERREKLDARVLDLEKLKAEHQTLLSGGHERPVDEMYHTTRQQLAVTRQRLPQLEAAISQQREQIKLMAPGAQEWEDAETQASDEVSELQQQVVALETQTKTQGDVLTVLGQAGEGTGHRCPVCQSELGDVKEAYRIAQTRYEKLEAQTEEVYAQLRIKRKRATEIAELVKQGTKLADQIEDTHRQIGEQMAAVDGLKKLVEEERERFKKIGQRLTETTVDPEVERSVRKELSSVDKLIDYEQSMITDLDVRVFTAKEMKEKAQEAKRKLAELVKEKRRLNEKGRLLSIVERMFSKKEGVPAFIIENAIDEIESRANDILKAFGGEHNIVLESQKTTKSTGKVRETLEIYVVTAQGSKRDYRLLSGGEKAQVNIALRLALSELLSNRYGVQVDALFIDESMGAFDETNRATMLGIFRLLNRRFKQVYVISHHADLRDVLPNEIVVTKRNGVSTAAIHGE